jgi:acyl carrier protein phosphodiesterase
MNFFAHLALAEQSAQSRYGNLLGDFCHGIQLQTLPPAIHAAVLRHRAVDRFTDSAAEISQAKALFSRERRRFAPVIIDVLFDHFLLKHWASLDPRDLSQLCQQIYQQLWQQCADMPPAMAATVSSLVREDWFASYQQLDNIGFALDKIANRIRFHHSFAGAISEIRLHRTELEALFLQFYPRLQHYVAQLGPELDALPTRADAH